MNRRHKDFQSSALPTELPSRIEGGKRPSPQKKSNFPALCLVRHIVCNNQVSRQACSPFPVATVRNFAPAPSGRSQAHPLAQTLQRLASAREKNSAVAVDFGLQLFFQPASASIPDLRLPLPSPSQSERCPPISGSSRSFLLEGPSRSVEEPFTPQLWRRYQVAPSLEVCFWQSTNFLFTRGNFCFSSRGINEH